MSSGDRWAEAVVDAFYRSDIGVGHALMLAKLPADLQQQGLTACFKKVYTNHGDKPARILLPVRNLRFWIETNVLLLLKDAPFDKRNVHLVAIAGSCVDCPNRTGHNKLLFADLGKQDACKLCGIWATTSLRCWLSADKQLARRVRNLPSVLLELSTGGSYGWRFCCTSCSLGSLPTGCG